MRGVIGCMAAFVPYKMEWADFRLFYFIFSSTKAMMERVYKGLG